ncbi:MAG: aspartate-semialdehyde dehydrogenase [Candidatus Omnitrophica bacterium 4484_70.2]|nr:MAG: aspartate-semialdehyde dehydrogenase [Candidatus Omnitrophica bacterium 4484_70.2]
MKKVNVAIVGIGVVGREILRLLIKRGFPYNNLRIFARSSRRVDIDGKEWEVEEISAEKFEGVDIALFAGTEGEKGASVLYAPEAIRRGCIVIDNGSDFRLKEGVPLVVPEINIHTLKDHKGLIANPNCSTIQMVLSIYPIYKEYGIERIIVSTYQSASGAGRGAQEELLSQTQKILSSINEKKIDTLHKDFLKSLFVSTLPKFLPHQISFNCIPQIGSFTEEGFTTEEWKMVRETHKILEDNSIKISATCVRVPVFRSHCEAIYLETKKEFDIEKIKNILANFKGVILEDEPQNSKYPLPLVCANREEVFVGRIRKDPFNPRGLWIWSVSDNIWKGAALNAIQIAEKLLELNYK